ncbi:hypothetical protein SUDANB145_06376 [Streptomyces sp. enrichment culture]|uniref:hypothetical protein n=1 Tax=Streptomyces sp. enrichment culture TaxID=1795815 RepID=UPI003F569B7E
MPSRDDHTTWTFGTGSVTLRAGAPRQFTDTAQPDRRFLLDDRTPWHSVEHTWGSGHLLTDAGAGRWNAPDSVDTAAGRVRVRHTPIAGITVEVTRWVEDDRYLERYTFTNTAPTRRTLRGLGIQTPFADLYENAAAALRTAVHAHVFTGGAGSWVLAQPVSGTGRCLGLTLRSGRLAGYSVESRNTSTLSNARGHLVLNVTDHAAHPTAFGGQPLIELAPGDTHTLEWALDWYESPEDFERRHPAPLDTTALATEVGQDLTVPATDVTALPDHVRVRREGDTTVLTSAVHGPVTVRVGDTTTEVLFHLPVPDLVQRRVAYIVDRQRSPERPGLLRHAFVPVDTTTGLSTLTNGWSDWTDGSERIAMPILLLLARQRGWISPETADPLVEGWAEFARAHLLDDTLAPRRGSQAHHVGVRLYDSPWLASFFLEHHRVHRRPGHLETATAIIERAYALGAGRHLAIGLSETVMDVANALDEDGQKERAARLREEIVRSAHHFIGLGDELPEHEVAYEHAIVAPLLNLLIDAWRITADPALEEEIAARLPWLLAFSGRQPHIRLHGVAIRHWDGFWFGQDRLFGDVFPHYWSVLTASALYRLPPRLRTPHTRHVARSSLLANLANYRPDGSATCAFVMPSTVDGRQAHKADPLANDQDWHLVTWLRLARDHGVPLA